MIKLSEIFNDVLTAKYTHLEEETASYCFAEHGNVLTIYFEWSNGKTDWKNNFDFPAKPYRDMADKWYAHRGFLKVWKAIEPHLEEVIKSPEIELINIAGYSHGAAIALLCHEYCKFNRPDCEVVGIGFGAPRVIWGFPNKIVKERFKGFYVVRNKNDIVTHVPPAVFGYRHPCEIINASNGEKTNSVIAHYPQEYTKSLISCEEAIANESN